MDPIDEHLAAVLIEWVRINGPNSRASFTPRSAANSIKAHFGIEIEEAQVSRMLESLVEAKFAKKSLSPLTNGFFDISVDRVKKLFFDAAQGDSIGVGQHDPSETWLAKGYPIIDAYLDAGSEWINFVVAELQTRNHLSVGGAPVPASDRIVTLQHNQVLELDEAAEALLTSVEAENSIEEDTSLRLRFLGQINAGRELIRAQTLNAYLLYQTLISMLAQLMQKYQGHAIGETAKQLWGLLLKHIFTGQ